MSKKSSSQSSLDKVPQKEKKDKSKGQEPNLSAIKLDSTKGNQSFQKELDSLQNASLQNKSSKSNRSTFQKSIQQMEIINKELDDLCKITDDCVRNTRVIKNYQTQVNQSSKTGELRSNNSVLLAQKFDTRSIQASIKNDQQQKTLIEQNKYSGITSVLAKVPSYNPLSNEVRIVMKHEGIQTEEKQRNSNNLEQQRNVSRSKSFVNVPKLQIQQLATNNQINENSLQKEQLQQRSMNTFENNGMSQNYNAVPIQRQMSVQKTQSRFSNTNVRHPSQQMSKTYNPLHYIPTFQQQLNKPTLMLNEFYRHSNTNISHIQQNLHQQSQSINNYQKSYQQYFDTQPSHQQQLPYRTHQHSKTSQLPQGIDSILLYQSQNQRIITDRTMNTGRFSYQSNNQQYAMVPQQFQQQMQQPFIHNLDDAIQILMKQ